MLMTATDCRMYYLHSTLEKEQFTIVRVKELLLVWSFLRRDTNVLTQQFTLSEITVSQNFMVNSPY